MTNRESKEVYSDADEYIGGAFAAWASHDEDGRPELIEPPEYLYDDETEF